MTDSSEDIGGGYCDPMFLTNRPLTREDLKRMYQPGGVVRVTRHDRFEPLGAPPVHADPRHPLHHLWVDAEDRMGAQLAVMPAIPGQVGIDDLMGYGLKPYHQPKPDTLLNRMFRWL